MEQKHWRIAGGITLGLSIVMALIGVNWTTLKDSPGVFFFFWGSVFGLLGITLLIAFIDLRYVRLQFQAGQRDAFKSTLGDENFRVALKRAQEEKRQ